MPPRQGRHRAHDGGSDSSNGVRTGWQWVLTHSAARQLRHLGEEVQRRITAELDLLAAGSPPVDIRKLEGENDYRLRVGDYRAIYRVDKAERTFVVLKISDRKDACR
jgi:mRNA interferase RelE/StbE